MEYLKIKLTDTTAIFFYRLGDKYMRRIIYAHPDKQVNKYIVKNYDQYEEFKGDQYKFDGDIDNLDKELENFKPVYNNTCNVITMLMGLLACKCDVQINTGLFGTVMNWMEDDQDQFLITLFLQ